MRPLSKARPTFRIHAFAASFGDDLSTEVIQERTKEGWYVLDPFVGAGTTALRSILSNRNAIGMDVDPLACSISRVLTSRFEIPYLINTSVAFFKRLNYFKTLLIAEPRLFANLAPGHEFQVGPEIFSVPDEPAIGYWFDVSHMATLSIACGLAAREHDPLVRQMLEVGISSAIIRKWPNTVSYAMDIDHSRPHKPRDVIAQPIHVQFALLERVIGQVANTVLDIQRWLVAGQSSAEIMHGNALECLPTISSDSIDFALTSPPYFNAIDYPRAHKFSQWWLSPQIKPLPRSEYIGLRKGGGYSGDTDLLEMPALTRILEPFKRDPKYGAMAQYVVDLDGVIDELHRVLKPKADLLLLIGDNVIGGTVFPVSKIVVMLLRRHGFCAETPRRREIKSTRRRYPFGVNGFSGPMKDEYLVMGTKSVS